MMSLAQSVLDASATTLLEASHSALFGNTEEDDNANAKDVADKDKDESVKDESAKEEGTQSTDDEKADSIESDAANKMISVLNASAATLLEASHSVLFGNIGTEEDDTAKDKTLDNDDDVTASASDSSSGTEEDPLGLEARFPTVSKPERDAFRKHFVKDDVCVQMLEERVQFRAMFEIDSPDFVRAQVAADDQADWEWAAQTAIQVARAANTDEPLIPGLETDATARYCHYDDCMPQVCFTYTNPVDGSLALTKDGKPFVHGISASIDLSDTTGASNDVHATAIALYLERKSMAFAETGFTFFIDTRQGTGWPNHNVFYVLPSIKLMAWAMDKLHPGQTQKLVLFPVPFALTYVFNQLRGWLPTSISETVELLDGTDGAEEPPPREELERFLDTALIDQMERTRRAQYRLEPDVKQV